MRYDDLMAPQTYISRQFYEKVKLSHRRATDLAKSARMDSTMLSHVIHRRRKVRVNDPRFLKLGKLLGLQRSEIFDPIRKNGAA